MAEHLSPTMTNSPDVYSELGVSLTKNFRNQQISSDDFETSNHQLNQEQSDDPLWAGGERLSTDNLASMFDLIQARLQTATTNDDDITDARPSYTSSPIINRVRSNESILSDITIDAALSSPSIQIPPIPTTPTIINQTPTTTRAASAERYNTSNTNRINTPTLKSPIVAAALEGVKIGGNNRFKSPPKNSTTNNFNDSANRSNSPTKIILKTISKPSDVKELLAKLRPRSSSGSRLNSSSSSSGAMLNSPAHLTPTAYSVGGSSGRYKSPTTAPSTVRSSLSNSLTPTRSNSAPRPTTSSGSKPSTNSRNTTPTLTRGNTSAVSRGSTPNNNRPTSTSRSTSNNRPTSTGRSTSNNRPTSTSTAAVNPRSQTPTSRIRALLQSPSLLANSSPPRRAKSPSVREIVQGSAGNRYSAAVPPANKTQPRTPTTPSRSTTPSKPAVSTPNSVTKRSVSAPGPSAASSSAVNRGLNNSRSTTPSTAASTGARIRSTTPTTATRGATGSTNSRPTTPSSTAGSTGVRRSTTPTSVTRGGFGSTNSRPTTPNSTVGRSTTPNSSAKLKLASSTGSFNSTPSRSTTPNKGIIKTRTTNSPAALSAPSPGRSTTPNKGIIKTRSSNTTGLSSTPSTSRNTTPNRSGLSSTPSAANRTPGRSTTPTLRSSGTLPSSKSGTLTPTQNKRSTTPTGSAQNSRPSTPNSNRGTAGRNPTGSSTGPTPASRLSALVSRSGPGVASRVQGSTMSTANRPSSASKRTTSPSTVARMPSSSSSSTNGSSISNSTSNKLKNVLSSVQSAETHPWGGPSRKQDSQKLSTFPAISTSQPLSPPTTINLAHEDDELALIALPSLTESNINEPKDHLLSNDEAMNEIYTTSRSASRNSGTFDEALGASEPGNMNTEWVDNDVEKSGSGKIEGIARSPGSNDEFDTKRSSTPSKGNKPPAKPASTATRRPSSGRFPTPEVGLTTGSNKGTMNNRSSTPDRRNSTTEATVSSGTSMKKRFGSVIQPPTEEEQAATQQLIKHVRSNFTPLPLTPEIPKFYMPSLSHSSQSAINSIYRIAKISEFATKSLIESNNQTQRIKSPDRQRPIGLASANSLYGFNSSLSSNNSLATTKSFVGLNSLSSNSLGNTTIATNTTDGNHVSMTSPLTASWEELNRMTEMEWTADSPMRTAEHVRHLKSQSSIARINSSSSMLADDEDDDSTIESATFANIKARIMKRSNSMLQYEEEMERAAEDAVSVLTTDSMATNNTNTNYTSNATNSTPFTVPASSTPTTSVTTRHASPSVNVRSSTSLNQLNHPSPLIPTPHAGSVHTPVAPVTVTATVQPVLSKANSTASEGSRPSSGVYTISPTTPVISTGLISPAAAASVPAAGSLNTATLVSSSSSSSGNKSPTNRSVAPIAPIAPAQNSLSINTNLRSPSAYGNNFGSPSSTQSPMLKTTSSSISSASPSSNYSRPGPSAAYGVPVMPPPSTGSSNSSNQNSSNSNGILSVSSLNSTSSPSKYRPYSTASNASNSGGTSPNIYSNNYNSSYNSYSSPVSNSQGVSSGSSIASVSSNVSGESPSRPRPGSGSFAYPPVVANSLMQSRGIPATPTSPGTSYIQQQQQQQRYMSPSATAAANAGSGVSRNYNIATGNSASSVGSSSGYTPNRHASPYTTGSSGAYGTVNTPSTGYGYAPSSGSSASSSSVGRYVSPGGTGSGVGGNGLPPLHNSKPPTSPYKSYTPAY